MYTMCNLSSCTLRCRLAIAQVADEDRKDVEGEDIDDEPADIPVAKAKGKKSEATAKSKTKAANDKSTSKAMKRPAACHESDADGSPAKKTPSSQDEKDDPPGPTLSDAEDDEQLLSQGSKPKSKSDAEDDEQLLSQGAKPKSKSKSKTKAPKAVPNACAGAEGDEFVALRDRVKNNKFQALFDTVPQAIQKAFKEACKYALCQSSHMLCECLIFCRCVVKTYLLIVFNNKHAVCT